MILINTSKEAIDYMESLPRFGSKLTDLSRMKRLCTLLGNPEEKLKFIHIAGTNGKGSTSSMLTSILVESGYKTGTYTSPYLEHFSERIRINQQDIEDEKLVLATNAVIKALEQLHIENPSIAFSQFEIITAVALVCFLDSACDIVVFEVGLGGRLDATNVIPSPILSVISTISLDHCAILGNTLEEIAAEKAGIIKKGGVCVVYPAKEEVCKVFEAKAASENASLIYSELVERPSSFNLDSQTFILKDYEAIESIESLDKSSMETPQNQDASSSLKTSASLDYASRKDVPSGSKSAATFEISLLGGYQLNNAALAVKAARTAYDRGLTKISDQSIAIGLKKAKWPARFELLSKKPIFIIDGSHNPEGVEALVDSLNYYFPGKKIRFIVGVLADKLYNSIIEGTLMYSKAYYTVRPDTERALASEELSSFIDKECKLKKLAPIPTKPCKSLEEAVKSAFSEASEDDIICAYGSLYYISQCRYYI